MAQVETKEVLIDYINTEVRRTKMEFNDKFAEERKNTDERIDKLILEELTHEEGFFGKEGSIMIKKEA